MENNIPIYIKCQNCLVQQMIKSRAFEIYEYRQEYNVAGFELGDWLDAEREVLEKINGGYRSLI